MHIKHFCIPCTFYTEHSQQVHGDDGGLSPTNVWFEAEEDSIKVHWKLPPDSINPNYCVVAYYAYEAFSNPLPIKVPVSKVERQFVITGLRKHQPYIIQMYCVYGGQNGVATQTFRVSTRTVSVEPPICPGSLPNAALEQRCLGDPHWGYCKFICNDGYRQSDVPDVLGGRRTSTSSQSALLCEEGDWVTRNEDKDFTIQNICLPEAEFEKCPSKIPHGTLEPHCGPATDWLCEFECDQGYNKHAYMLGRLKNFLDHDYMLNCDGGAWMTGFEHLGVDISTVCVPGGPNCTDDTDIPNGEVPYLPCPSGYVCGFQCDPGYRKHALARTPVCHMGEWILTATKYDPSITLQNICVPEQDIQDCPNHISHGRLNDDCKINCYPKCDTGYYLPGRTSLNGPGPVTCENGKWLTDQAPYNVDNVCFPEEGHECPYEIANGISSEFNSSRTDDGSSRGYISYKCNVGFRKHRSIPWIECVAGKWVTWQERFGIDTASLCIPFTR